MTGRRRARRRRTGLVAVAVLVPALLASHAATSLARLTDVDSSVRAISTDTLDPPSFLAASGGATAALTWIATPDAYATGYELRRATASGGPYSVVATITPLTTVAAIDAPATSGTYFYVLRSTFQNWRSVASNEASATITFAPTTTGFLACTTTSNAADSGGDGNGYESNPTRACVTDGSVATDASSGTTTSLVCTNAGKDRHRFWDFGLGVPASVTAVAGIEVQAAIGQNHNAGTNQVCVQLSWDGGTTWTATKSVAITGVGVSTYTLGAGNDTWGRTWLGSELSNASFRVRIVDVSDRTNKDFRLDGLAVQVSYIP
jgi:hypothetical protein